MSWLNEWYHWKSQTITLLVFKYILWKLDYREKESIYRRYGKKNEVLIDHYSYYKDSKLQRILLISADSRIQWLRTCADCPCRVLEFRFQPQQQMVHKTLALHLQGIWHSLLASLSTCTHTHIPPPVWKTHIHIHNLKE